MSEPAKQQPKPTESFQLEADTYQGAGDLTGLAQYCNDLHTEYSSSSYRDKKLKEIKAGRKQYDNERDEKTFPWPGCSNISVGLTGIAVDNLEPRIVAQVISSDDFLACKPVGPEDVGHAEAVQEFLGWALRNNVKVDESLRPLVHDYLLDGTIDVLPVWRERTEEVRERTLVPKYGYQGQEVKLPEGQELDPTQAAQMGLEVMGMRDTYKVRERTRWRVEYILIPLDEAFYPDNFDSWDDQPYLRYIYPTLEELELMSEENGGPYKNITRDLVIEGARNDTDLSERIGEDISYSEYTKEVRLLECYVKWRGEWTIASFAVDRGWIEVRRQPLKEVYWSNRKPVRRFRLFPDSKHSMGTGIPRKIRDYSVAIDDLWNEMIDSGTMEIVPWFTYQAGPGFKQLSLDIYPGKGIEVPRDSNVQFPNLGIKAPQFMAFIDLLMGFFERTISLSAAAMGKEGAVGGKGMETFSGMSLIVNEGNIKHNYQAGSVKSQFAALFKDTLALYGQYLPLDATMRIQDKQSNNWLFRPVDVVALQGEFDVEIEVSSASANKMLHRKEMVELGQMLAQNPIVNPVKPVTELLKAYDIRTTEDWVNPEFQKVFQAVLQAPEIVKLIDQYMQQKAQKQKEAEVAQQAKDNIQRQEIERQVEREAGAEDTKLFDQVTEGVKRKLLTPIVEEAAARGVME